MWRSTIVNAQRSVLLAIFFSIIGGNVLFLNSFALGSPIAIATSSLAGTSAQLAFDFIDGGSPSNSIIISAFSTDGLLGSANTVGGVSGILPSNVTLTDTSFFNEYLQDITLANSVLFDFSATGNAPALGSFPDSFSFFLLNAATGLPLLATSDPTGANAFFSFDITGANGGLQIFSPLVSTQPVSNVPESNSIVLLFIGLIVMLTLSRRYNLYGCRGIADGYHTKAISL